MCGAKSALTKGCVRNVFSDEVSAFVRLFQKLSECLLSVFDSLQGLGGVDEVVSSVQYVYEVKNASVSVLLIFNYLERGTRQIEHIEGIFADLVDGRQCGPGHVRIGMKLRMHFSADSQDHGQGNEVPRLFFQPSWRRSVFSLGVVPYCRPDLQIARKRAELDRERLARWQ